MTLRAEQMKPFVAERAGGATIAGGIALHVVETLY